jgi:hypothetical protein
MRLQSIAHHYRGMTNQMVALINAILRLSRENVEGDKVLVVGSFMTDIATQSTVPLSEIIDFPAFQKDIRDEFGIHLYSGLSDFRIEKVVYRGGKDITEACMKRGFMDIPSGLSIKIDLNKSPYGDPCYGTSKHLLVVMKNGEVRMLPEDNHFLKTDMSLDPEEVLAIHYGTPDRLVDVTSYLVPQIGRVKRFSLSVYPPVVIHYVLVDEDGLEHPHVETLHGDEFYLDLNMDLYFRGKFSTAEENSAFSCMYMGWMHTIDFHGFEELLPRIPFRLPQTISSGTSSVSVIHARIEPDMVSHFLLDKEAIVSLYQRLILEHIPPTDQIMVLCADQENDITRFLDRIDRKRLVIPKRSTHRELNAVMDAASAEHYGNSVFLGMWNPRILRGSSFSYFLSKRIKALKKTILFDMKTLEIFRNDLI